jgi:hypothetical protein
MENASVMLERAGLENLPLVVLGEFNSDIMSSRPQSSRLQNLMLNFGFTQLVSEPTRVKRESMSMIDLLYTTNPELFDQVVCHELGISNHNLILGVLHVVVDKQVPKFRQVRCFGKCNMERLVQELKNAPWHLMA